MAARLAAAHQRIEDAMQAAGRTGARPKLLAVSKRQPASAIYQAAQAGQLSFGENYVQEALDKRPLLDGLALDWHLVGPLQSNKTKAAARYFDWIHTIDRLKVARRLSAERPAGRAPLQLCIQVKTSDEASKSGVAPEQLPRLARDIAALPYVRLRGLMTLPAPAASAEAQRRPFRRLAELFEALQRDGLAVDTLSMGMSDDLEAAVAEGATLVRLGTAIFGTRAHT